MRVGDGVLDTLDVLEGTWRDAEVLHKRGRSRTLRHSPHGDTSSLRQEEGWAVRAGDDRRSFFYTSSGAPNPEAALPEADGEGLRLASARPVPAWKPPSDLDAPLLGENEARALFAAIARELDNELPGAKVLQGFLEDGSSEQHLASNRGVRTVVRQRTAALQLEARGPRRGGSSVHLLVAERQARRFSPPVLARRLADRLLVVDRGEAPDRDRGEFLLGPAVTTALLVALSDLWLGPPAAGLAKDLMGRSGRLANRSVTLVDDGRLPGGVLDGPVDGEGMPTRETVLWDRGLFRQPLLAWWQAKGGETRATGCCRRASWRDLPKPGPSHLYLRPDSAVGVASMLRDLRRGYYLLGTDGAVRIEPGLRRFAVPVSGFAIDGGQGAGTVAGAWLLGTVSTLLQSIVAVARDLTFLPMGAGMVGAPTVLVRGLELRREP
ncbi:MAG: metallopeptidase TldD-related protein [Acidobacteriota bacterium]